MSSDSAGLLPRAAGNRRDYALDPRPIARGGQATVFAATHKPTGRRVAFKRLDGRNPHMVARMRREIEAARLFGGHPNVMPVLDSSADFDWFVMPLAEGSALAMAQELSRTEALRELVTAICEALRLPHERGWIHRDLKPDNVLWLDGRWVVADWGLGRRPRGQTSDARRTQMGALLGTEGFAAPELAVDAHAAGPQADIYSIGQIIGWALTGGYPRANIPLLPDSGPWRAVVKAATTHDVKRRLASIDDLLATMAGELDSPDAVTEQAARLLADARAGDPAAPPALLQLAARVGELPQAVREGVLALGPEQLGTAIAADAGAAAEVVRVMRAPESADGPGVVAWLLAAASHAERGEHWDLLDETVESLLSISARLDDGDILSRVGEWIGTRSGQAASTLAVALRRLPAHPRIRAAVSERDGVDHRVRRALRMLPETAPAPPAVPRQTSRRRRALVVAAATTALLATATTVVASQLGDRESGGGQPSRGNPFTGVPKTPGELALPGMDGFVEAWDNYPSWAGCRSGSGDTAITGSFPARPAEPITPAKSIHCDNGGSLTAMFAEFRTADEYKAVSQRYLAADRPATPALLESEPPEGLHVFQWSDTQRALVWSNPERRLVGLLVTSGENTDLVELWNRYEGSRTP